MTSWLDRLFGVKEEPAVAKAVTGPGAFSMEINPKITSLSRTPQTMARQAMEVYRSNEWINACESLVDDKFATVPWHLEDQDGETVTEDDPDPLRQEILRLLRNPNPVWTGTAMRKLTARHMGLPGRAFWYLDALDTVTGIPRAIYMIPPDRMFTATDKQGNLLGWVMDLDRPDGREPVPFTLDEIIQFPLDPPDHGYFGVGKVEAAWRKAQLVANTGDYANMILASGGRIPGLIFPKDASLGQEQWEGFVRAVRDSTSGERRMSALRSPVEYVRTAESPEALRLPDLSTLSRDDILGIWKVPPSQLGIIAARGMNSGETQKYEEASLWQNAIEPRLATFAELIQLRLLDRHNLRLVLETPNFDDELPVYQIVEHARYAPVSVDEKRALLGQDPLDPDKYGDLGTRIFLDNQLVQVWPEPEVPEPLEPVAEDSGNRTEQDELPESDVTAKAKLHFDQLRAKVEKRYQPRLQRAVGEALQAQKADLARRVSEKADHLRVKPNDVTVWWNEEREYQRLLSAVEPILLDAAREVTQKTSATFFRPVSKADSLIDRVLEYVRSKVGARITGINQTTREKVQALIADNITASPRELGDLIGSSAAFDEYRSELIARTETMLAYNDAAIGTYRDFDVREVVAIDGDHDAECAARDGNTYTIDEASTITDHPNGTLDWAPVVN